MDAGKIVTKAANHNGSSPSLVSLSARLNSGSFLRYRWFHEWCRTASLETSIGISALMALALKSMFGIDRGHWASRRTVKQILAHPLAFRDEANQEIIERVIKGHAELFDTIEKFPLTDRQREAVASDEDATLVVAGAGTGKTSTILAKIGLLLKTQQCAPHEILAISYTRKSADELAERVEEKLGIAIGISTFHKLGLSIVSEAEGKKPRLAPFVEDPNEKAKHIDRLIEKLLRDNGFRRQFIDFNAYQSLPIKEVWQFKTMAEYQTWLQSNKLISLDGKPKKSYQELVIANFLLRNGIRFVYEDPYEHDTSSVAFGQYHPDFHVLEPSLYIEHFGVDENGSPAPYIDATKYREGMEWKRNIHRTKKTTLLETFSWEHSRGILLENLEQKLRKHGCKFAPIPEHEVLEMLNKAGLITAFAELVATFLTLYKGNGSKLINDQTQTTVAGLEREKIFLNLFHPIFLSYEEQNKSAGQIDFEDMITRAASAVRDGKFASPYKYILVDEFQDISPGRAELVRALQQASEDCALFAVGDDWQSIYRFAGSDIGAMTHFDSVFGATRRVALDTTFRFNDFAINTSSRFVLKNTAQIKKTLKPVSKGSSPSVIIYKRKDQEAPLDWCLKQIAKDANGPATVLILERYNFHLPDKSAMVEIRCQYPDLEFSSMTVHGAKGLEKDYVIAGLRGGRWGFPCTKSDDPLLSMVLTQADQYEHGEERRLFYVALTRARQKTFLVCESGIGQSIFSAELESEEDYRVAVFGVDTKKLVCAKCGSGTMTLRDGINGKFYGCSNFPLCSNTQQTCPQCRVGLLVSGANHQWECHICDYKARTCPKCESGVLAEKNGQYGNFFGCSNYRDPEINCRYTERV